MTASARPPRPQTVLRVLRVHRPTTHLVRLTLADLPDGPRPGADGFDGFAERWAAKDATDQYVKLLFAEQSLGLVPPYDMDALREHLAPEQMPVRRTYTVRRVDTDARTLDIDVVHHGDDGLAGPWAARAEPGDVVAFFGPGGAYRPDPNADAHVLAGDESALPAIAASLEDLARTAPQARGVALIEVAGPEDELELLAPAGVRVCWLHRGGAFSPQASRWPAALAGLDWPAGRVHAFVHGEREQVKIARRHLTQVRGMDRREMSVSAYWAYGRVEDAFQAEKRTPVGQIFED